MTLVAQDAGRNEGGPNERPGANRGGSLIRRRRKMRFLKSIKSDADETTRDFGVKGRGSGVKVSPKKVVECGGSGPG